MLSTPNPETQQFNQDVQGLLKPQNPQSKVLLSFIRCRLYQFGLQDYFTAEDIFIEAYLRGVTYTHQRRLPINHPRAWMKSTAYNVIRERKRERLRFAPLELDEFMAHHHFFEEPPEPLADCSPGVDKGLTNVGVVQAFQQLNPCDRNLIQWRYVEGLSWQAIQEQMAAQGQGDIKQSTLRKRGQRAMERFRQLYLDIDNGDIAAKTEESEE
jgi:DNA-directed RNA polymerase specialized sigma24 family protein